MLSKKLSIVSQAKNGNNTVCVWRCKNIILRFKFLITGKLQTKETGATSTLSIQII
jgi:hypothetical protein